MAIINYHSLCGLNRHLFIIVLDVLEIWDEGPGQFSFWWESASWCSQLPSCSVLTWLFLGACSWRRLSSFSYKGTSTLMRIPSSSKANYLPKSHLQVPSQWGLSPPYVNFEGTQTFGLLTIIHQSTSMTSESTTKSYYVKGELIPFSLRNPIISENSHGLITQQVCHPLGIKPNTLNFEARQRSFFRWNFAHWLQLIRLPWSLEDQAHPPVSLENLSGHTKADLSPSPFTMSEPAEFWTCHIFIQLLHSAPTMSGQGPVKYLVPR